MKNGEIEGQIPDLVANALVATFAYSLEQLKKLPHASEVLSDVLNPPGATEEGAGISTGGMPASVPSSHGMASTNYQAVAAMRDPYAAMPPTFAQETGRVMNGAGHLASPSEQAISAQQPSRQFEGIMDKTHPGVSSAGGDSFVSQKDTGMAEPASAAAVSAASVSSAGAVHYPLQQQSYLMQPPQKPGSAAGAKGGAAGGGKGGNATNGNPMSKQQAKLHQQAHLHSHPQHHHMMMGHMHPGYVGYPPMPHGAPYGIPPGALWHRGNTMAPVMGRDYANMPPPGSEIMQMQQASARDPYCAAATGGTDAAKTSETQAGMELSYITGKSGRAGGKVPAPRGPAGKAKCRPPHAAGWGRGTSKSKADTYATHVKEDQPHSTPTLGVSKGQRGTRVVSGKMVSAEGHMSPGIIKPSDPANGNYNQTDEARVEESPSWNSMLTLTSPTFGSTYSPMTPHALAPLSDKTQRLNDPWSSRLAPDQTPGSTLGGQLPHPQWLLSPLLKSKESPMATWTNSPGLLSSFSPQQVPFLLSVSSGTAFRFVSANSHAHSNAFCSTHWIWRLTTSALCVSICTSACCLA